MPEITDLNVLIAFGGGLLSFFSPCVLPLLPAYLVSLGAGALPGGKSRPGGKPFWLSLAFVAGFSLIFVLMGLSLGFIGTYLAEHRLLFTRIGGGLIILFGLSQLGILKLALFQGSWSPALNLSATQGAGKLFLMGLIFSLGWSPCVGPILAGILFLAVGAGSSSLAVLYLSAYTLGLALPFLLLSFFVDRLLQKLRSAPGFWLWLSRLTGALLILMGGILISGKF